MRAIIITRGQDTEAQVEKCKKYALLKGYEILEVVENIRDLTIPITQQIDVVIASHMSRITRKHLEYHRICNSLKEYGVTIEIAK